MWPMWCACLCQAAGLRTWLGSWSLPAGGCQASIRAVWGAVDHTEVLTPCSIAWQRDFTDRTEGWALGQGQDPELSGWAACLLEVDSEAGWSGWPKDEVAV